MKPLCFLSLCALTLASAEAGTTRGIVDPSKTELPAGAVQLVGEAGYDLVPEGDKPTNWTFADGVLTAPKGWDSVLTKEAYRDFRMHLEFNVNAVEDADNPEKNGNSGVYIQQRYELQILNSFGVAADEYKTSFAGSLYRLKVPDRLVSKKAGEWQSYDIAFRAARYDGDEKVEDARITVYHNGELIHDDFAIPRKTGAGKKEGPEPLPIKLQGHNNPVRFRNVWVEKLDLDGGDAAEERWLTCEGKDGPGKGKHIVLISADQEYRSEQSMPMMARTLSERHGFDCTVLFGVNAEGLVDPTMPVYPKKGEEDAFEPHSIPGLENLEKADLVIFFTRLLTLPDEQMAHIVRYLDSGKAIIGLRTANHGFRGPLPYLIDGKKVRFGDDVLGGSFRGHHGNWHRDSTRGELIEAAEGHPVLAGVRDIWGPSDVYRTYPEGKGLPDGCTALVNGQPLIGRERGGATNPEKIPLPVAWVKHWKTSTGKSARVFHSTMGSARDLECPGLRRLVINAAYWCLHLEGEITPDRSVEIIGDYEPLASGFNYEKLGVVPKPVAAYR